MDAGVLKGLANVAVTTSATVVVRPQPSSTTRAPREAFLADDDGGSRRYAGMAYAPEASQRPWLATSGGEPYSLGAVFRV